MKNVILEPLPRRIIDFPKGIRIKADMPEVCSFTLEKCYLASAPAKKRGAANLCPFTLEPVCMRARALSAVWD